MVVKSSWLISLSISAFYIVLSTLFNLLLASITILLCFFFLFPVAFNNFFTIPEVKKNAKLKLGLALSTDALIMLAKEAIEAPPLVADKKKLSKHSKAAIYLLSPLLINYLLRISAIK